MSDKKWIGFLVFKIIVNITGVALILFLSAGTIQYQTGWVFVILLVVIATLYSVFMIIKQPDLFKKRFGLHYGYLSVVKKVPADWGPSHLLPPHWPQLWEPETSLDFLQLSHLVVPGLFSGVW
jgi:hypothetical protein